MSYVDRLIELGPFDYSKDTDSLFMQAMRECVEHHFQHSSEYRAFLESQEFAPDTLTGPDSLARLPFVFVNIYKHYALKSVPDGDIVLTLTSSGTGGQKSRIFLDQMSLDRVRLIARKVYQGLGMVNQEQEVNYLLFTYDPRVADDLGTAFTDELLTGFTRVKAKYYALQWDDTRDDFFFNRPGVLKTLMAYEQEGIPVRLVGFPAFIHEILTIFKREYGRSFRMHPDSWVLTGGGWKSQEDQAVSRDSLRAFVAEVLGISGENIRDLLGMVEHGVPYVECHRGRMHVPIYGRVVVRDTISLEPLDFGQVGMLSFITPYLRSYPSVSILTGDFGMTHEGCDCGLKGPVVEILGRAGTVKHKGCAISAESLLRDREEANP